MVILRPSQKILRNPGLAKMFKKPVLPLCRVSKQGTKNGGATMFQERWVHNNINININYVSTRLHTNINININYVSTRVQTNSNI